MVGRLDTRDRRTVAFQSSRAVQSVLRTPVLAGGNPQAEAPSATACRYYCYYQSGSRSVSTPRIRI